ncbi:hypothetical protein DPMN_189573 [Dreissena polymorpha]|uniref:Uncharacterized protein n=1 Tax=Dreissena polymorpha TaxID=45954 RepID=A0A9D4DTS9_DREPO|nr:hypothetical protein DPMN_189573 [Dreissena polymorpha]
MVAGELGVCGRAVQSHVEWVTSGNTEPVPTKVLLHTARLVTETRRHLLCA